MPNELSIQGLTPLSAPGDPTAEPKAEPFVQPAVAAPAVTPQPYVNPSLRLDAALGLVVIEFRDDSGTITSSIPSQRQLEAYRMHEQSPPSAPGAMVGHAVATASGATASGASASGASANGATAGTIPADPTVRAAERPSVAQGRGEQAPGAPRPHVIAPQTAVAPTRKT